MDTPQEILNFLTRQENLHIAMEVGNYIEELKRQTHYKFWAAINQELHVRVEAECTGKWIFDKFNLKHLRSGWEKTHFRMIIQKQESFPPLLKFALGQSSPENNYRVFCGVSTYKVEHQNLTTLRGLHVSLDLDIVEPNWVGWGYLPITPHTVEFISGMHNKKEEFVSQAADIIWEKFTKLRPEIETINQQILQEQV